MEIGCITLKGENGIKGGIAMNVYNITLSVDCGTFTSNQRNRNIIANSEHEAERKLFELLHERAKKQGRILHYIDVDFWKVEKIMEGYKCQENYLNL